MATYNINLDPSKAKIILNNYSMQNDSSVLQPYQALVFELKKINNSCFHIIA